MRKENVFKKEEIDFFELAIADKRDTGLPFDIALDSVGSARESAEPCVYVVAENVYRVTLKDCFDMKPESEDFAQLYAFVVKNRETLMNHWYKRISDRQVLSMLERLG